MEPQKQKKISEQEKSSSLEKDKVKHKPTSSTSRAKDTNPSSSAVGGKLSQDDNTTKPDTNYHQIYLKAWKQRCEIEAKAAAAQKKQADGVNKNREWEGCLVLERDWCVS
jgi:hypothetical protein